MDDLIHRLQEASLSNGGYTKLSSKALAYVSNPPLSSSHARESTSDLMQKYLQDQSPSSPLPPHIYRLASDSIFLVKKTGRDSVMLFSGISGSGKTALMRQAAEMLVQLSKPSPGKKGSKLVTQIPHALDIVSIFSSAQDQSSCGIYAEIQLSDKGRLAGLKLLPYCSDVSRVTSQPIGEGNFDILHALMAGASDEERDHMQLPKEAAYRYLGRNTRDTNADAEAFDHLKLALRGVAFGKRAIAHICQLMAAIIHIGQLEFHIDTSVTSDSAVVKNHNVLETVADFLGVDAQDLEQCLTTKTTLVNTDTVSFFLDAHKSRENSDCLSRLLYHMLFNSVLESINSRLCKDDFATFAALLDLPGFTSADSSNLHSLCVNHANEKLHAFIHSIVIDNALVEAQAENLPTLQKPPTSPDYAGTLRFLEQSRGGLLHILNDQTARSKTDESFVAAVHKRWTAHPSFVHNSADSFTINHYSGPVNYDARGWIEQNQSITKSNTDFVLLLARASNPFVQDMFSTVDVTANKDSADKSKLARKPSTRNRADSSAAQPDDQSPEKTVDQVAGANKNALDTLFGTLRECTPSFVFVLKPNSFSASASTSQAFDSRYVASQARAMDLVALTAQWQLSDFDASMTHAEFLSRYGSDASELIVSKGWNQSDLTVGTQKVFLSAFAFKSLEDNLSVPDPFIDTQKADIDQEQEAEVERELLPASASSPAGHGLQLNSAEMGLPQHYNNQPSHANSEFSNPARFTPSSYYDDGVSNLGTEPGQNMFSNMNLHYNDSNQYEEKAADPLTMGAEVGKGETVEILRKTSSTRYKWLFYIWAWTWWLPSPLLTHIGRMKRPDIRQAWREKFAINLTIWFISLCAIFVIAVLGNLICPTQHVYSTTDVSGHKFTVTPNHTYVSIRGEVFSLSSFLGTHSRAVNVVPQKSITPYGGSDISNLMPVQISAVCNGMTGGISPYVALNNQNESDSNHVFHDFRASTTDYRPDWYYEQMIFLRYKYRVGFVGFTTGDITNKANSGDKIAIFEDGVYDLTPYGSGGIVSVPDNQATPSGIDTNFMSDDIVSLFTNNAGSDLTLKINSLNMNADTLRAQKVCMRNLFFVGKVDHRNSPACLFSRYILLVLSIIMVVIIGVKFLAALHFGSPRKPEDHDKFVICQIPCYTEGEESLRRTIDSIARLKYDDKRKLLFIICDGNIVGAGNDKPTPRIVLDILGVDPALDPEPLSFRSLGDGNKQHNLGKVYSGLYECAGHVVPYIVVAKVGKPTERGRPGNRGKRDSQMLLMWFLNKVHFDSPMNPLELEVYHQIKNVIGVNPSFYEYCFQVDADTSVDPLSVNRMVSAFMHDRKIMALCGETSLSNAKQSLVTMMQVYEYYISHYLAKSFESLFGSVTCLPGCFSMYRIRTSDTHKPLFVSNQVIEEYSENLVDTLHMKNLLHLGEDRYLTTLMLKHFPQYKTTFCRDAKAQTVAPDDFNILLSQRRRWINSTIHNLAELVFLDKLCGFCCFSMRFFVFIDLLSTIIAPVTVAYIVYLIYLVAHDGQTIPTTSIIMLAAIYGLQAIIFILNRKWEHVGWMIVYIFAIPVFSFALPLYSFWHMDDFSWGNTRVVVGEKGKKLLITDEGAFDEKSIPLKSWQQYEAELWEQDDDNRSIGSREQKSVAQPQFSGSQTPSMYAGNSQYGFEPPAAPFYNNSQMGSPAGSAYGGGMGSHYGANPVYQNSVYSSFNPFAVNQPYLPVESSPDLAHFASSGSQINHPSQQNASKDRAGSEEPTDLQLESEISQIIASSDLETLTKKGIRKQLEANHGEMPMRRQQINNIIDKVLSLA